MATTKGGIIQAAQQAQAVRVTPVTTMRGLITRMMPEIKKALPTVITPERFTRMVMTAVSNTPQLAECTGQSFMACMMQAAQLGVEPNTPLGQAYLIPYRNHGQLECQFQIGYKGILDLAYRSGMVTSIQAHEVCENDVFECEYGIEPQLRHKPAMRDRGAVIAYYAVFKTKDGGYGFEGMSKDDIMAHAKKYSQSFGKGFSPWASNFDEMAKKTVLKRVLKYAPLKTEFARALASDGTIKSTIDADMSTVNDETEINVTPAEEQPAENGEAAAEVQAEK